MALGRNLLVAFMPWRESQLRGRDHPEPAPRDDVLTSRSTSRKHEIDARDTKLGAEEITRDIPNIGEMLANLDDRGIIRIGAEVGTGDILVGKVTPKGDRSRLRSGCCARSSAKAREVRDTSMKVPHGEPAPTGAVFDREEGDELPPGVNQLARLTWRRSARSRWRQAGRTARQQGRRRKILPVEDMPFMEDGTPVDIVC
ncbi:MAG: hypothetical protein R2742_08620 [Micropruina glycogenica]